ncbi:hypothetical protein LTR08_005974 [Meristemomyces frigidus]|nr:hypothetical protein LTR08_005974 [Meristemomyces frigidus]
MAEDQGNMGNMLQLTGIEAAAELNDSTNTSHALQRIACSQLEPSTPKDSSKTLLGLPVELRCLVYEALLNDLVATPKHHPWDAQPSSSRFAQYVNLLLTSRQVHAEAEPLFKKDYSHRITYYLDNAVDLIMCKERCERHHPALQNARFSVRAQQRVGEDAKQYEQRSAVQGLWEQQPGFYEISILGPGYYRTSCELADGEDWDPTDHGFRKLVGDHDRCLSGEHCRAYTVLEQPPFANNCRLTTYQYTESPSRSDAGDVVAEPADSGCVVLDGRLADIGYTEHYRLRVELTWMGIRGDGVRIDMSRRAVRPPRSSVCYICGHSGGEHDGRTCRTCLPEHNRIFRRWRDRFPEQKHYLGG